MRAAFVRVDFTSLVPGTAFGLEEGSHEAIHYRRPCYLETFRQALGDADLI